MFVVITCPSLPPSLIVAAQGGSEPSAAVGTGYECQPGVWPDRPHHLHTDKRRRGESGAAAV